MRIIPVLDLAAGAIVHARGGDRARYLPVSSTLGQGSHPHELLAALVARYRFDTIYVADLDAIAGTGDNSKLLGELAGQHTGLRIWLDCGPGPAPFAGERFRRVVGSEYGASPLLEPPDLTDPDSWILSLDYRHGQLEGSVEFAAPEHWPRTVIVLDLDRVGSGNGAGQRHRQLMSAAAAPRCWVAGGGISGTRELARLAGDGLQAVLVASALYSGSLAGSEYERKKMPRTGRGIS